MIVINRKERAGFGLVEMVISLAIMALLYYVISKKYMANPVGVDKQTQSALASQGINPNSLPDTVNKAGEAADKANKANKQIENAFTQPPEQ